MIITCPRCAAQYAIDPTILDDSGTRFRCSNCSETWVVGSPSPGAAPEQGPETQPAEPTPEGEPQAVAPESPPPPSRPPAAEAEEDEADRAGDVSAPPEAVRERRDSQSIEADAQAKTDDGMDDEAASKGPDRRSPGGSDEPSDSLGPVPVDLEAPPLPRDGEIGAANVTAESPRTDGRQRGGSDAWVWPAIVIGLLVIAASALVVARDHVVAVLPAASGIYAAVGLETPGEGLAITLDPIDFEADPLELTGVIRNVSDEPRPVPAVRWSLVDAAGDDVRSVIVAPERDRLAPGEEVSIEARIENAEPAGGGIEAQWISLD